VRSRRAALGLSQDALARAAGVSQALVSRVERGLVDASLDLVEQLLAVMNVQLHPRLEAVGVRLESDLEQAMLTPAAERLLTWSYGLAELSRFGVVFEGPVAAALQGVPMPIDAADIAILPSAIGDFTAWLRRRSAQRWSERWHDFSDYQVDPREPGRLYWHMVIGDVRARICARLPESIEVTHEGVQHRVRPLTELEMADPMMQALLRRYRERLIEPSERRAAGRR
jgi:transcriptional regulator with XRE-family HTH domain